MKKTIEALWFEYYADKCAAIETEEERRLTKRTAELHERANAMLSEEQRAAVESFVDALCEVQESYTKKAFRAGCELTLSFFLDAGGFYK